MWITLGPIALQATVLAYASDPSVSTDDLMRIFSAYGDVRDATHHPQNRNAYLVDYYDGEHAQMHIASCNVHVAGVCSCLLVVV